jgi:hypothetical protein
VTLTSIDEPVVVLLERFVRVATAGELDGCNTERTAVLSILELALAGGADGRREQLLKKGRRESAPKVEIFRKENSTNLDLSFVYVRGEVGHDDFLGEDVAWHRGPRCWSSSGTACRGVGGGLAGDSSLSSTCSTTGTAGIPLLVGNNLWKRSYMAGV